MVCGDGADTSDLNTAHSLSIRFVALPRRRVECDARREMRAFLNATADGAMLALRISTIKSRVLWRNLNKRERSTHDEIIYTVSSLSYLKNSNCQ